MTFDTTHIVDEQMARLMELTGAPSKAEVLRSALRSALREHNDEYGFATDDLSTLRHATACIRSFAGHQGGSTMTNWGDRLADFADRYAARSKVNQ